jgi:hypothetical protein
MVKLLKFILQTLAVIFPIVYSAYTRDLTPLLLLVWAMIGAFLVTLKYESEKYESEERD